MGFVFLFSLCKWILFNYFSQISFYYFTLFFVVFVLDFSYTPDYGACKNKRPIPLTTSRIGNMVFVGQIKRVVLF